MTNREKIQYVLSFVVDFLALVLSLLVSWVLFGAWLHLILPYSHSDVILFHLITFAAFCTGVSVFRAYGDFRAGDKTPSSLDGTAL